MASYIRRTLDVDDDDNETVAEEKGVPRIDIGLYNDLGSSFCALAYLSMDSHAQYNTSSCMAYLLSTR